MNNTSPIAACTIVSKNYLSLARVWNASVQKHHPGARTFVLIVDRIEGTFDPAKEPFEVIEVEQLGIPDFQDMAFKYNILELNTAVKPFFLEHLFRNRDVERLAYFDPDTVLYGPIDRALEMLVERQIVVVPHILRPQTIDGRRPNETDFLISGAYNLGFLVLRRTDEVFSFLRWWQERLIDACFSAPERGLFTDQKWIDLVPSIFSGVGILKDRGYNVAYWNLHERMDLEARNGGGYRFPECPLTFFHFSGIEFARPEHVSKYQNRFRFHTLSEPYQMLYQGYVDAVRAAGFAETRKLPYSYGVFDDGVPIPQFLRQLYYGQGSARRRWGDPFRTGTEDSFRDWLLTPSEFGSKIPRLLSHICNGRPDVRKTIPDAEHGNARKLLTWAILSAKTEYKFGDFFVRHFQTILDEFDAEELRARAAREEEEAAREQRLAEVYLSEPETAGKRTVQRVLTPPVYRKLRSWAWRLRLRKTKGRGEDAEFADPVTAVPPSDLDRSLPRGVNLFGYFDTESGVGEIARSMASMLADAGIPHALVNIGQEWLRRNDRRFWRFSTSNPYAVNLFMVNADQVPSTLVRFGEDARRGRINIGYWFWELSRFPPAYARAFDPFDEVWVATEFCREAVSAVSPIPVVKIPPGFEFDSPRGRRSRNSFGIRDDDFVFLYVFDSASLVARKNPAGLIHAFRAAFPNPSRERLVLKTTAFARSKLAALERLASGGAIDVLNEYLDRHELLDLLAAADCYVSLHRSEGLGLTLLESMALAKPVVATGYSGNEDFLRPGLGFPVGYRLVPIRRTIGPYEKGAIWAEPDLADAARWMRWVRDHPADAARVGAAARDEIRRSWSVQAASRGLRERLDRIFEENGAESPGLRRDAARPPA